MSNLVKITPSVAKLTVTSTHKINSCHVKAYISNSNPINFLNKNENYGWNYASPIQPNEDRVSKLPTRPSHFKRDNQMKVVFS